MTRLFLIPTTLANNIDHAGIIQTQKIKHLQYFIVETAKIARAHLKQLNLSTSLQQLHISELNKHSQNIEELVRPLLSGNDVGLISDCGMPAIADPGNKIVQLAHKHAIQICPIAGPSSLMMALMASGLNGQNFAFTGYLPIDAEERKTHIKRLEELIVKYNQSQIIIETPFRNNQLLQSLIDTLSPQIHISISTNLMNDNEQNVCKSVAQWKKALPDINKQEAVFVIGI
jgi:16S rRNA (cytidine1402-2'-O)-methyltransferase